MTASPEPEQPAPLAAAVFALYKNLVSPILHALSLSGCLYRPTCSEYAYVALARFGPVKGVALALRRILRCHPWARGGFDPVPNHASVEPRTPPERLP